uniref:Lipocalin n=1 Tax=Rhipicephalus appendiculatus TaxID=34631 RepID=A0A131YD58_RHIAP
MTIKTHSQKEKEAKTYRLLFWLESEKCFILERPDGTCEQHTWHSNIWSKYECDKVFWSLCGAWTYPVFKQSCINPKAICVGLTSLC